MNTPISKLLYCLTFLVLLSSTVVGQNTCDEWGIDLKSVGDNEMSVIYSDSSGIVVTAGKVSGGSCNMVVQNNYSTPFLSTSAVSTGSANTLVIALKDPQSGSTTRWVKGFGCTNTFFIGDIHYRNGITYVAGYYNGAITFGPFTLTSAGQRDAFLVKLDANGDVLWALSEGGTGYEQMRGLAVDDNNIYISGFYMSGADFSGTTLTSQNNTSLFVASYEIVTGSLNWIKTIDGTNGKDEATKVSLTADGSLYIAGFTSGGALVNANPLSSNGGLDCAVVKMDTLGNFDWVTTFGGTSNEGVNDLVYDPVNDIIYVTGVWASVGVVVQGNIVPNAGGSDAFVGCLDPAGILLWVVTGGSTGNDSYDVMDVTSSGDAVASGYAVGNMTSGGLAATSTGGVSVAYTRVDAAGVVQDLQLFGGTGDDVSTDIVTGKSSFNDDNVFIAGYYEGVAQFGSDQFSAQAQQDGFLWSLCLSNTSQSTGADVWPGDADYNGIANNWDILPIGLIYGDAGPVRPSASNVWVAQPAADWGTQFVNGADYKHVDCDGNGEVDLLDVVPILLNYGQSHPKRQELSRLPGPTLSVDLVQSSVLAGDTAEFSVDLGMSSYLARSVYGIAFTINYNPDLVVLGSFNSTYDNSWLGDLGIDMEKLDIELSPQGKFDVGMTRTDRMSLNGAGKIMSVSVITIDNISGKDLVDLNMPIWISDVKMVDENGVALAVETQNDTLMITDVEVGIEIPTDNEVSISIYPNPADDNLTLNSKDAIQSVKIYNNIGQVVLADTQLNASTYKLVISDLKQGLHVIEIQTTSGSIRDRLMIVR